jgi:hypothetical protein
MLVLDEAEKEAIKKMELTTPMFTISKEGRIYEILKSDGVRLHQSGWFTATPVGYTVSEPFFAFTRIRDGEAVFEQIEPFLLIFEFDKNMKTVSKRIEPLNSIQNLELNSVVAEIERSTLLKHGLSTQMSLSSVNDLIKNQKNVDLANIFNTLQERQSEFIDLKDIFSVILNLWSIASFFSDVFMAFPNLMILGVQGSGKTRATKFAIYSSRKGLMITDVTEASLFRLIDALKPALGIDDFDQALRNKDPMVMSLLKHTYKRGISIPRLTSIKKGTFNLDLFEPFAPLVYNSTEPINDPQLLSRSIIIETEPTQKKFFNFDPRSEDLFDIREELYRARFLLAPKVFEIYKTLETGLMSREDEVWRPILTIAKLIGEELYEKVLKYAGRITEEKKHELYQDERVIVQGLIKILGEKEEVEFTVKDLCTEIQNVLREEYNPEQIERIYNVWRVGNILERLHIKRGIRSTKRKPRIINREELLKLKRIFNIEDEQNKKLNILENSDEKLKEKLEMLKKRKELWSSQELVDELGVEGFNKALNMGWIFEPFNGRWKVNV